MASTNNSVTIISARAMTCTSSWYLPHCHDRAETAASHWVPCQDSWLPGPDSWLPFDWLWTWVKLAITRWSTWAVQVRLCLQANCQCCASTWTWSKSLAAARPEEAELLASGAPNPHQLAAQVTWYQRNRWYHRAMISDNIDIIGHIICDTVW